MATEIVRFTDKATRRAQMRAATEHVTADTPPPFAANLPVGRYSIKNQILVYLQCPTATETTGVVTWREKGRAVRKGEKAIWIYAPFKYAVVDDAGDAEEKFGCRLVPVFDVSQTEPCEKSARGDAGTPVDVGGGGDGPVPECVADIRRAPKHERREQARRWLVQACQAHGWDQARFEREHGPIAAMTWTDIAAHAERLSA